MSERLEAKTAIVTGGGNGIGRARAERFAAEGAAVVTAAGVSHGGYVSGDHEAAVKRLQQRVRAAAVDPLFGAAAYPVSKAGVWMFTKNAARNLAGVGIRVNAIGPGFIQTNMTEALDEFDPLRGYVIGQTPMRRQGRPEILMTVTPPR